MAATSTCERSATDQPDATSAVDAAVDALTVDALVDGPPCTDSFSLLVNTCGLPMGPSVVLQTMTIDTASLDATVFPVSFFGGPDEAQVRFVVLRSLTVSASASVTIVGPYPISFLVDGDVRIDGDIELATGAGSRVTCPLPASPGGDSLGGGSGGGGGGWHGTGGAGGGGDSNGTPQPGGGGGTGTMIDPTVLLAGCPGGHGGNGVRVGGVGGRGGGAISIASSERIEIKGNLGVGGGGGGGPVAMSNAGGGGGGSGGTIYLEAQTLRVFGRLTANGGGGGGGTGSSSGAGTAGDTASLGVDVPHGGIRGSTNASAGGDGAFGGALTGASVSPSVISGGGGGGGGAGYIVIRAEDTPQLPGILEPAPTQVPYQ